MDDADVEGFKGEGFLGAYGALFPVLEARLEVAFPTVDVVVA
jgi:hypothetical protein